MTNNRMEKMRKLAERLHESGTVDQITMRKINVLAEHSQLQGLSAEQIKELREREGISQGVLATILNMSSESIKKWEQGKSQPKGAALKLLTLIQRDGIQSVL